MDVPLILDPPRDRYERGWGHYVATLNRLYALALYMQDLSNQFTSLTLDLIQNDSPLTLSMDVLHHSVVNFSSEYPTVTITRPTGKTPQVLPIYVDGKTNFQVRGRILTIPIAHTTSSSMVRNSASATSLPMVTAKRMHRFTHASTGNLIRICRKANWLPPDLENSIRELTPACRICAELDLPAPSKKVSSMYVN